jgi:hypothetical protein
MPVKYVRLARINVRQMAGINYELRAWYGVVAPVRRR